MADNVVEPDKTELAKSSEFAVVGIGASAGGLEALRVVMDKLSKDVNAAYIIAQHLSPTHTSMLSDLLAPSTSLVVVEIEQDVRPKAGHAYITPPNHNVEYDGTRIRLTAPTDGSGPKPSVDHLFHSLARNSPDQVVGVVLSGTGSDGAAGLRAIKGAGGITIVQDPDDAKYDGMPRAAAKTGLVDLLLPADEIAEAIRDVIDTPAATALEGGSGDAKDDPEASRRVMMRYVKARTGFDLADYKESTVSRRLAKRMAVRKTPELDDYVDLLKHDSEESKSLVRDLLISVTEFFRDPDAFESLRETLAEEFSKRDKDTVFRVWVPGCATGEEAYTIAIILTELSREMDEAPEFLIFATDVDEPAVGFGRAGVYPMVALAEMNPELRDRYFEPQGQAFAVRQTLRQSIVFAVQNVIDDPPFSRLDLVSCRNLMIYFTREAQQRVIHTFNYSLNPGGLLFLGHSESLELHRDLFSTEQRRAKIFRKADVNIELTDRETWRGRPRKSTDDEVAARRLTTKHSKDSSLPRSARLLQALVEQHCPPTIVVDRDDEVVHLIGDVQPYITLVSGPANLRVFDLVDPELRAELRALLHRSRRESVQSSGGVLERGELRYRLIVRPVQGTGAGEPQLISVSFETVEPARASAAPAVADDGVQEDRKASLIIAELDNELAETRMRLQTVVEELETSNEELQSQSEELQSSNEELQSTNEELQTSNEELQSTNEELLTVNDEIKSKSDELEVTATALFNIKESLSFPLLVVDSALAVRRINNTSGDLIRSGHIPDLGTSMLSIEWLFDVVDLIPHAQSVLKHKVEQTTIVPLDSGETYEVQIMPFLDSNENLLGLVLVFNDISRRAEAELALRQANAELRTAKQRIEITLQSISEGVIATDTGRMITYVNPTAAKLLGVDAAAMVGQHLGNYWRLRGPEAAAGTIVDPLSRCLVELRPVHPVGEWFLDLDDDRQLAIDSSAAPLFDHNNRVVGAVLAFRDVTSQRLLTDELTYRAAHDPLTGVLNRDEFERRAESALDDAKTDDNSHVLLYIDLDQFKIVNDTVGHSAGDELLKQVCELFRSRLRQADVLARLGGDEFGMILRNCGSEFGIEASEDLIDALQKFRFTWGDRQFTVGATIGLTVLDKDCQNVSQALSAADSACYAAKDAGRGRVQVSVASPDKPSSRMSDMLIINHLNAALDEDRLLLQPEYAVQIQDQSHKPYRELLLRMISPDGEVLPPGRFIPAAERYYLMGRVDRWVFDKAVELLQKEQKQRGTGAGNSASDKHASHNGLVTSINISGQTLGDKTFLEYARQRLREARLAPGSLCIEITETAAISQLSDAIRLIESLKMLGCRFALDDFGAGMSSFGYLRALPVNYIKIDGVFVRNLIESAVDRAIVEVICKIARELRLEVVAEYVTDHQTVGILKSLGVELAQGELFGIASVDDIDPDSPPLQV